MDILIIASLIIGAVILFLVELFVIPGISVAGFLAGGCIIFANYWLSTHHTGTYPDSYCPKNFVVLVQKQSVSKTIQIKQSKNGMAS